MNLLITGATGFIGKDFLFRSSKKYSTVFLLVRKKSKDRAKKIFSKLENIEYIIGDIENSVVCENPSDLQKVISSVDVIFNLAGGYNLEMSYDQAYLQNIIGVQNILNLARKIENLKFFHHVSSYAVNGKDEKIVYEDDLKKNYKMMDNYSKSKMIGESLVRSFDLGEVRKRIYRPGIVIASEDNGVIEKIDGPYYFFKFLKDIGKYKFIINKVGFLPFPLDKEASLPLIPVNILSNWFEIAILKPSNFKGTRCYHFILDENTSLIHFVEQALKGFFLDVSLVKLDKNLFYKKLFPLLGLPLEMFDYLFSKSKYSLKNRKEDFPELVDKCSEKIVDKMIFDFHSFQKGKVS